MLDPFGGVGSTLIAAEKTGRRARLIELDPRYVDATVKRWEALTGAKAVKVDHDATSPEADRSVNSDGAVIREADKAKAGGSTAEGYARGGEVGTSFTGPSPQPSNEGSA